MISLCGSTGDTKTAVYTDGCAGLILACNDDACGLVSEVRFPAVAGQTYDIRIGNFAVGGGSNGSFTVVPDLPTQNPSNGHFYRVVSTSLSWIDARAAAETTLFQGMPGHSSPSPTRPSSTGSSTTCRPSGPGSGSSTTPTLRTTPSLEAAGSG